MPWTFKIKPLTGNDSQEIIKFLFNFFYSTEPCFTALNVCPRGYQIPALEEDISDILKENLSSGIYLEGPDDLLGCVLLSQRKEEEDLTSPIKKYPQPFIKRRKFLTDVETKYGTQNVSEERGCKNRLDVAYLCVR